MRVLFVGGEVLTPQGWGLGDLLVEDSKIKAIGQGLATTGAEVIDARGLRVVPGFIDLHVHGGGGADTMNATPEAFAQLATTHARHGTTAMVCATVTATQESLRKVSQALNQLTQAYDGARVLGLHIEGPYINPNRKGAHNSDYMRGCSLEEIKELQELTSGRVVSVTLAPEAPGAFACIQPLVSMGILVNLGHSDATYDQTLEAVAVGARVGTHTFNAMRPFHHREPGIIGGILTASDATAELIADGIHVHPGGLRLAWAAKGTNRVTLVTDAMEAVDLPDGVYNLGGLTVYVKEGSARLEDGTLAGSTLTMERAIFGMVEYGQVPLADAIQMASLNPARLIGLDGKKGSLEQGKDADVVLLENDQVVLTMVEGRIVYQR